MQFVYYKILPVESKETHYNQIIFWQHSILIFTLIGIKMINTMSVQIKF